MIHVNSQSKCHSSKGLHLAGETAGIQFEKNEEEKESRAQTAQNEKNKA